MNRKILIKNNSLFHVSNTFIISSLISLFSVAGIYLKINYDKKQVLREEIKLNNEKIKQETELQKFNLSQLEQYQQQQEYLLKQKEKERLILENEIKQTQEETQKYQTTINNTSQNRAEESSIAIRNNPITTYIDINLKNRKFWLAKMPPKTVVLTFDDGPSPEYTEQILDILKKHNVKATFFVVGYRIDQYCPIVKRIVAEGHELGNHTYHHNFLAKITPELQQQEIYQNQLAINNCVGNFYLPKWLRSPYGSQDETTLEIAHNLGLNTVLWSIDTNDWRKNNNKNSIISEAIKTRGQDIILMHDATEANPQFGLPESSNSRQNTVNSLEDIIIKLKGNNINFVTMSQAFLH